jgi:extracellular factor (EF) 3-hydroxypalmitic acid methyl ester biosynthesis protein
LLRWAGPIYEKLADLHRRFEDCAQHVPQETLGAHKAFFQREIHPLVMRAPFLHRTYTKPLGYAGDYEMMNMIHREEPEGASAYAKIINTAYVRLPIARCVINRAATLEEYLRGMIEGESSPGDVRILSVGCGPAVEVQRVIANCEHVERARFVLLDFNQETLAHAESRVHRACEETGRRVLVEVMHRSVHSLLKGAASPLRAELATSLDFVYCAGLFDYLSDRVCARLVRLFYDWVVPGGRVLVTNMNIQGSNRFVLEHLADWYLIYRTEQQMSRLVPGLGRQRVFTDETGVNICLEVEKPARASGG